MDAETTVFVVDGDPASQEVVRDLASAMNLRSEVYASGAEFLDSFDRSRPGCVVLELQVPGISGLEIQERLAEERSSLPVIFLTQHADVSIAVEVMRSGAVHFLEKPFRANELWRAIQEAIELNRKRREAEAWERELGRRIASLTAKERRVLTMLSRNKASKEIAAELNVCVRTVEVHRANLIRKLDVSSLKELLDIGMLVRETLRQPAALEKSFCLSE